MRAVVPAGVALTALVITPDTAWVVGWTPDELREGIRDWHLPHKMLGRKPSVLVADVMHAIADHAANAADRAAVDDDEAQRRVALADRAERLRLRGRAR